MTKKIKSNKPQTTEIIMQVSDIKNITDEDLEIERSREDYKELLLKVYWYLKGIDRSTLKEDEGSMQLREEIEDFL